jgi:glycerol-3-phosphate dehydrogenase (NAD(P)+)
MNRARELEVVVVGGGAFGTTLAALLAERGRAVELWVRRPEQAQAINREHVNPAYLPGVALPASLKAVNDLGAAVRRAPFVLLAVPSQWFREAARAVGDALTGDRVVVHATKGLERVSGRRMSEILHQETCARKVGVLTGPCLAREIGAGLPAGALCASRYDEVVERTQGLFAGARLRVYGGRDVVGAEVCGAFKNIIALAAGVADGLGLGDNAKALLLTRGLSEMARFVSAQGGDVLTCGGLAGVGDLITTCASSLSRNHQFGVRLARGEPCAQILASLTQVAEGVPTCAAVHARAGARGLDMPIVRAVHGLLYEEWGASQALEWLMARPVGVELATLSVG